MFNPKHFFFREALNLRVTSRCLARVAALLALWSIATVAIGANWFFQPAGSVGAGYEDNADLTDEDPIDTTSYELEASARGGRLTERSQVVGNLSASFQRYPGNKRLDSDNLSATLSSAFLPTELDRLSLDLSFDHDTSRRSELTTTGNIIENVPRSTISIGPAWQRRLTERSTVGLGYIYSKERFDSNVSGLVGSEQDDIDAFYTYQLTERLALRGTLGAVSYDPDDDESYKGYGTSLGLDYAISETLGGNLEVGWQRIDSETDTGVETIDGTASGLAYDFNLSKDFSRSSLSLSVSRSAVPTGSGEPLVQERLGLGYAYKFSPRLSVTVPAVIFRNERISFGGGSAQEDERRIFFTTQPRLKWRVTEDLVLSASYRYRYERFEEAGTSADSNAVFLSLSYVWPTENPGLSQ